MAVISLSTMDDLIPPETVQQMNFVKPNRRLGNRKSKQGCLTCKARKVKCDETRPHCKRCHNSNRDCLGYGDVFVSAQFSKLSLSDRDRSRSRSQGSNSPPIIFTDSPHTVSPQYTNSSEARSLQYYQTEIAELLGGSIETSFWKHSILQLSESEPAIRQALVAVSSLWEARLRPDVPDRALCQQQSIEEYTKALTLTAHRVARPDADNVALATCVLFLCMHYLEEDKVQAEKLLRTGSNVLQTVLEKAWQLRESTSNSTAQTFLPIFERMLLLLRLFGIDLPQFRSRETISLLNYDFTSLDEARGTLYWLVSESHDLLAETKVFRNDHRDGEVEWSEEALYAARQRHTNQLHAYKAWQAGFTQLCKERIPSSLANDIYKSTLRLTYAVTLIWVSSCFDRNETEAERFQDQYEEVIREAGKVIAYNMAAAKVDVPFTFEMGLIAPLYLVSLKCREPKTRYQAVSLLERAPKREGLWKREDALRVVRRVIQIETSGTEIVAEGVVFRDANICDTQTRFTDHQGTHVTFYSKLNGQEEMWKIWDETIPL